ncbi:hypothetical protein BDV96DRAFT_35452 [Lophiotrema nucula]|uniref:Uncharacterized protein n=1 Tax=Lophiotrema nucula TaxID=690887 RepID=A0A6A5ZC48_9PLEO|nr:hypothetical protein BDV96DRAFT_35452 [Lophiotrema nucula]
MDSSPSQGCSPYTSVEHGADTAETTPEYSNATYKPGCLLPLEFDRSLVTPYRKVAQKLFAERNQHGLFDLSFLDAEPVGFLPAAKSIHDLHSQSFHQDAISTSEMTPSDDVVDVSLLNGGIDISQAVTPSLNTNRGTYGCRTLSNDALSMEREGLMSRRNPMVMEAIEKAAEKTDNFTMDPAMAFVHQTAVQPTFKSITTSPAHDLDSIPLSQLEPTLGRSLAAEGLVRLAISWTAHDLPPNPVKDYGQDESPMSWCLVRGEGVGYRCCACQWDTLKGGGETACCVCGHVLCGNECFEI